MAVVEGLDVPLDEREIFAVVLGVTPGALLTGIGGDVVGCVQAAARAEAGGDFGVTRDALEDGVSAKGMATGAVGSSIESLMGPG